MAGANAMQSGQPRCCGNPSGISRRASAITGYAEAFKSHASRRYDDFLSQISRLRWTYACRKGVAAAFLHRTHNN
jgi:hypothetical protein